MLLMLLPLQESLPDLVVLGRKMELVQRVHEMGRYLHGTETIHTDSSPQKEMMCRCSTFDSPDLHFSSI
jgi:hypothetical protein